MLKKLLSLLFSDWMKWTFRDREMSEKGELLTRVNRGIKQGLGTLVICEVCDSPDTELVKK